MKILHTADWHLGVSLGAEKRFEEYDALLQHICTIIENEKIEAVIIAGDVFDTPLPPNRAAEQYYRFLLQAGRAGARDIIVLGGNHDSAAYLEAPKEILKYLSVHVFACASLQCEDMIITLKNPDDTVAALVGAIPYLHERDLLTVEGGKGMIERENTLRSAMLEYYRNMAAALDRRDPNVPHIVTGHLFACDDHRKNDSWTGTLMSVAAGEFPDSIDYLALGHLHDAHTLKTPHKTCVRYPGAPVNVSFRELETAKSVTIIDTEDIANIREIPLVAFQDMRILKGSKAEIEAELIRLTEEDHSIWCSIENTGETCTLLSKTLRSRSLSAAIMPPIRRSSGAFRKSVIWQTSSRWRFSNLCSMKMRFPVKMPICSLPHSTKSKLPPGKTTNKETIYYEDQKTCFAEYQQSLR